MQNVRTAKLPILLYAVAQAVICFVASASVAKASTVTITSEFDFNDLYPGAASRNFEVGPEAYLGNTVIDPNNDWAFAGPGSGNNFTQGRDTYGRIMLFPQSSDFQMAVALAEGVTGAGFNLYAYSSTTAGSVITEIFTVTDTLGSVTNYSTSSLSKENATFVGFSNSDGLKSIAISQQITHDGVAQNSAVVYLIDRFLYTPGLGNLTPNDIAGALSTLPPRIVPGNDPGSNPSAVPLPASVWSGLSVLAMVGCFSLCRRRRRQVMH